MQHNKRVKPPQPMDDAEIYSSRWKQRFFHGGIVGMLIGGSNTLYIEGADFKDALFWGLVVGIALGIVSIICTKDLFVALFRLIDRVSW